MYGCPYGYIYNSSDTLKQLQDEARFSYQPGVIVQAVLETPQGVRISGCDRLNRQPLSWECERVFLAAGAIPTTRILLRSLEAYDKTVWLKDSQYFLIPLMLLKRPPAVQKEWLHTLSQVFLEIFDAAGNDRTAHVQVYSNNDLINEAVEKVFGFLRGPLEPLMRRLQDRLLVGQGFLHSDLSSQISVRLKNENSTDSGRLELEAELNPVAKAEVRRIVFKLLKHSRRLRAIPPGCPSARRRSRRALLPPGGTAGW